MRAVIGFSREWSQCMPSDLDVVPGGEQVLFGLNETLHSLGLREHIPPEERRVRFNMSIELEAEVLILHGAHQYTFVPNPMVTAEACSNLS